MYFYFDTNIYTFSRLYFCFYLILYLYLHLYLYIIVTFFLCVYVYTYTSIHKYINAHTYRYMKQLAQSRKVEASDVSEEAEACESETTDSEGEAMCYSGMDPGVLFVGWIRDPLQKTTQQSKKAQMGPTAREMSPKSQMWLNSPEWPSCWSLAP